MEKLGDVETEQNRRRSSIDRLNRVRDEAGEKLVHLQNDEEPQAVRSWLHTWLRLKVDREDGENRVVEIVIF